MVRTLVSLVVVVAAAACTAPTSADSDKPLVLTTTTLFADMARNVAGDRLRVESIVPAGSPVEEYEPKPDDSKRVSRASLFLENGLDLDRWAAPLLRDKRASAQVVVLTEGLPAIDDNPHMWFDVQLARKYVEKMRDAFVAIDPDGKAIYTDNAKKYDDVLATLHADVRAQLAAIPVERRKLVTSHDAFPYLARAYGLEVVGFAQIEPGKDPTPAELADLVRKIRGANVPAIFSEAGVSPRVTQALAREAGVSRIVTDLPTDSVVAPPADTYAGVMRVLAQKIADALR